MLVVTDQNSRRQFSYSRWNREWEWDLFHKYVWSPYEINYPLHVSFVPGVETATILVGGIVVEGNGFKRVEVFEGIVYYVKPFEFSLPAQIYLQKREMETW